jgi:hypothetical protein
MSTYSKGYASTGSCILIVGPYRQIGACILETWIRNRDAYDFESSAHSAVDPSLITLEVPGCPHKLVLESTNCAEKVRPSDKIGSYPPTIVKVARPAYLYLQLTALIDVEVVSDVPE